MPTLNICSYVGCGLLSGETRCDKHRRRYDTRDDRASPSKRGYDRRHASRRRIVLARDPICMICRRRPSEHADHIVPLAAGGSNDLANYQGLCSQCHGRKTRKELSGPRQ